MVRDGCDTSCDRMVASMVHVSADGRLTWYWLDIEHRRAYPELTLSSLRNMHNGAAGAFQALMPPWVDDPSSEA